MTLPENYLTYPRRAYGMDQDLYDWRPAIRRPAVAWPGDRAVACLIVVPVEHHVLNPVGKPFKHPGAMVTPYPDLRHYTTRDYGNRVGAFRILKTLAEAGLKATVPINALALDRLRPLVDAAIEGGHEIAAWGLGADHIHWSGLEPGVEAGWIARVRSLFDAAGLSPRAWMSPARQQSFETLALIAEAGFDVCLDWEQDSVPVTMKSAGGPVVGVPLSNELDDRILMIDRRQSEDVWVRQILEARDYMVAEAPSVGGQVLGFSLTPYVSGQPFRISALRRMLADLGVDPNVWSATASKIAAASEALASPA